MVNPVYSVGDPIRARCTKCKVVTRHLIVALVAGVPARVQCTACDGIHNYRPPVTEKKQKSPASPRPVNRRARPSSSVEEEWKRLVKEMEFEAPVRYRIDEPLTAGQLMEHPSFGLGIVRKMLPPNTAEVLFREGIKRLRCGTK